MARTKTTEELFGEGRVKTTEQLFGISAAPVSPRIPGTVEINDDPTKAQWFVSADYKTATFGEKWQEYFFPEPKEARWTTPGRNEKFLNTTKWPAETAFKMIGDIAARLNKFITAAHPGPELLSAAATLDPSKLKGIFSSMWSARKALMPVPGAADELRTLGETVAEDWYKPITGEDPPWWYAVGMDVAFETVLFAGAGAARAARVRWTPKMSNVKLAAVEIKAAKRIFSTKKLATMTPAQTRAVLVREAATLALTKSEKHNLMLRGYLPTQIQRMTPLDAHQILADVSMADSAAHSLYPRATKRTIDNLTATIRRAKQLTPQKEKMIAREKARRVAQSDQIVRLKRGEEAILAGRGPLKGEYRVPAFTPPELQPADRFLLFESIRSKYVSGRMEFFRMQHTGTALTKLLNGQMPAPFEIDLLAKHFGPGLGRAILAKQSLGQKVWRATLDAANFPRASLASYDLSFALRQGGMLLPGHPVQWTKSLGQMMKSAIPGGKGAKYARYLEDIAENSRYAELRRRSGLEITEWGLLQIGKKEEPFMSTLAERIPIFGKGIVWAERTFTTMSNQLRVNIFDDIAHKWESAGKTWRSHPKDYKLLAHFLNAATGRGNIPEAVKGAMPVLNAFFFSPRFQISRPQVVYTALASAKHPAARKVIAKDLVAYVGTGLTALWLLDQIPGTSVESDPRSSDFGKVKYGNTRYDFWSGYSQIARLVVQMAIEEQKATGTGRVYAIDRSDIITRYIRTKLSPPAAGVWDVTTGRTLTGDEMSLEPIFIAEDVLKRVVPLVIQDIADAIRYQGFDGALPATSITALFGVSSGTWEPTQWTLLSRAQDNSAFTTFGKAWEDLANFEQRELERDNALLVNLKREAEYEKTVFPFLEKMKEQQDIAGMDTEGRLPDHVKKEMARLLVRIGSLSRTWGSWTLNDERYEEYQDYIAEELTKTLGPRIDDERWSRRSDESKRRFIQVMVETAKAKARAMIRAKAAKGARRRRKIKGE